MSYNEKEWMKEYHAKRYADRKAQGICVYCGRRPAKPGVITCIYCQIKKNRLAAERRKRDGLSRHEWPDYGMCFICGNPVQEGYRLCEIHLTKTRNVLAEIQSRRKLKLHDGGK